MFESATDVGERQRGPGAFHIKVTGVIVVHLYLVGVKIHGSVPLRVLKSNVTTVRVTLGWYLLGH